MLLGSQFEIAVTGPEGTDQLLLGQLGIEVAQQIRDAIPSGSTQEVTGPTAPVSGAQSAVVRTVQEALRSATITSALAQVKVRAAGWAVAEDVAEVREDAEAGWFVFDLKSMRTVTGVTYNPAPAGASFAIATVQVWLGTQFGPNLTLTAGATKTFSEQLTERLRVQFQNPSGLTVDLLRARAAIHLPGAPGDLRLRIDEQIIWSEPGPVRLDAEGVYAQTVDVTEALTAKIAEGKWPLDVKLSAAYPALISLDIATGFQRHLDVALPGGRLNVELDAPGVAQVSLPLEEGSDGWLVHALELTVEADLPQHRTLPSQTPEASTAVVLNLEPGRALALCLGQAWDQQFAALDSVWVFGQVLAGGAELTGRLISGAEPGSGEPMANVPPLQLEEMAAPGWLELSFAKAVALSAADTLWLELQTTRGQLEVLPAASEPGGGGATADPSARVLRGAAGGEFAPYRVQANGQPLRPIALTRLTGQPRDSETTSALRVQVGASGESSATPQRGGTPIRLDFEPPLSGPFVQTALPLQWDSRVAAVYRLTAARVLYTLAGDTETQLALASG